MEQFIWLNAPAKSNVLLLRNLKERPQIPNDVLKRKPLYSGPYLAGGQGGQLPPLGKLNVDFFNEVFVFDGIFLVAILVQNLKKTG